MYELIPGGLTRRLKDERKKKFDEAQRVVSAKAVAALASFEHSSGSGTLSEDKKKEKEELEARVKLLEDLAAKFEDSGELQHIFWCSARAFSGCCWTV